MKRKPNPPKTSTVVQLPMPRDRTAPPAHLGGPEAELWKSILADYEFTSRAELALLEEGLTALQRARLAREQIEDQGAMLRNRFDQPMVHPLLVVERTSRQAFASIMKQLRLDVPQPL
jgi:hypothetical protein